MPDVQHKRGTRAALDALAAAGSLRAGQVYLLTDEARIAVALGASAFQAFAKQGEGGGGGSGGGWSYVVKASDETRNDSAVLAADGALRATLGVGTWRVRLLAFFDTAAAPDFKYSTGFAGGAATSPAHRKRHVAGGSTLAGGSELAMADSGFIASTPVTGSAGVGLVEVDQVVVVTAAGEWQFNWAQNTGSSSGTRVLAGSTLEYVQAA